MGHPGIFKLCHIFGSIVSKFWQETSFSFPRMGFVKIERLFLILILFQLIKIIVLSFLDDFNSFGISIAT